MSHSQRRDVLKAAGTVAVIGGLAGCAEDEEPVDDEEGEAPTEEPDETQEEELEDDVGAFRVAHTSPDAPNVDVYFDDQAVIEDLAFREVSPYEEIEPGTYQAQVTAADDPDTVVFDEEIEVEAGVTNTAVAFGEAAGGPENEFTVEILEDDISDPGEETSRVRLFHASPDAEDVDIVVAEAPEEVEQEEEEEPAPDEEEEAPEEEEDEPPEEEPGEDEPDQTQQEQEPDEDEPAPDEEEPEDDEMPDEDEEEPEDEEPDEEPQVGEPLFEGVGFGDSETEEIPAGDYTLEVVPAEEAPEDEEEEDEEPAPDEEEEAPDEEPDEEEPEPQQQEEDEELPEDEEEPDEEPVDEFELSTESQTVYSAFAVGYVGEPEDDDEPEDEEPEEEEEEDDNGLLQDGEDEEFEVVIVEDAQDGERADGGTDGNGLLRLVH